jgi:predicted Holliday junction resolvase-like endonuclease
MGESADEVRRAASPDDTELAVDVPADDADIEAQHIRQEIEQTRAEMSSTIDAIQQKLSPEVVAEQAKEAAREAVHNTVEHAKEAVREATIGKAEEVVRNVADTAQGFMGSTGVQPVAWVQA